MDTLFTLLKILGSLGVFLYGMKVMSEGIQRCAGDRMRNIMFLHLPEWDPDESLRRLSLVNLFRVVFNEQFGTQFKLLDEHCWFSTEEHPLRLEPVPEEWLAEGVSSFRVP